MKKLVIASNNNHKLKEFKEIFKDIEILSLNDIGFLDEIEENGKTFKDNALIKAEAVYKFLRSKNIKADILADDSGLCCNALNGEPGVYSARYSGGHGNDAENRKKLINELKNKEDKSAYFVCNIIYFNTDGTYKLYEGKTYGKIIDEEKGDTSFGYDPIFLSDDLNKTFGEATSLEKNSVSHRGRAIKALLDDLK